MKCSQKTGPEGRPPWDPGAQNQGGERALFKPPRSSGQRMQFPAATLLWYVFFPGFVPLL